ncbi:hypothetical protein DSM106972_059580 [Dulcicalothrix desertica PCC 7102]|uniref:Uncharacterized protein n=2 Tax=Dulcicalothrix desertica TaxID=32056 RepID=A0A433V8N3_9CYAN|nr:hypothetical protein [Dulcicalothrix desertica]RUT02480.1 hypothetical protein DSM106972_059580 [Dulcicalothrix desertica PCC 7102]TWH55303.1 hypothetical protein CAL7102_03427 [Dulcicalothrix desertica PCC 7102]
MFNKGNMTLVFLLMLIFVGFGDSFLPKPLSTASYQTRTTINNIVIGMFPSWRPKTDPNKRTQEAIKEMNK